MLNKLIRANLSDLWLFIGVEGGVFLLVEVIIGCVMFFARPVDGISVAWVMLPLVAGFVALMSIIGHAAITFDLALRFGQTRRRAMGQFLGLSCFETSFGFALAVPLCALERFVCPALWARLAGLDGWVRGKTGSMPALPDIPGVEAEPGRVFVNTTGDIVPLSENTLLIRNFTLDWYWWLLIFAAALIFGIIIGALIQRFGQKGLWVIWGFWMVLMLAPQLLRWELFDSLSRFSPLLFPVVIGVFAVGLLLWSLWSMLHAVVRA